MEQLIKDKLDTMQDDITLIKKILTGNGSPESGVIVRLDRIEQIQKRKTKVFWTTLAAAITGAIGFVFEKWGK
jgi:hypothetical protein